jgi:hypothetical protein
MTWILSLLYLQRQEIRKNISSAFLPELATTRSPVACPLFCAHDASMLTTFCPVLCSFIHLIHLLLLVHTELSRAHVDQQQKAAHNRQDLEEIVLGKVLLRVLVVQLYEMSVKNAHAFTARKHTYRPEVVDQQVEDAENNDKHDGTPLGLEPDDNHDTSHGAKQNDYRSSKAPLASEDEANKQEDEQHTARKLKVHLAVLFVELRKPGRGKLLAHPAVRQHHQQAAHDGQIAQEEVEVEDEPVSKCLRDNHPEQTHDGVFAVLADNDHQRRRGHGEHVGNEEQVREAPGNCDAGLIQDTRAEQV